MTRRRITVSNGSWRIAATTSYGPAGVTTLHVSRPLGGREAPGDADGRTFPSPDAAWAYAFEHGYLVEWRRGWCPRCRRQHWWCGARSGACAAAKGSGYPGCEEAQHQFDASDRTWRDRRRRAPADNAVPLAARKMWA